MTQAQFSVHLGGGLYMDSNGALSHGPEPGKPVYSIPGGGLPVNLATLEKAFDGLAKALPNKDDPKSREKFDKILDAIGMLAEHKETLINTLQAVGAVASVIGSVVPVVGAALAILTWLLGVFKDGPSALELLVARRFDDLARQLKALETQIQQRDLRGQRSVITGGLAAFANFVLEMKNTPPDPAVLLLRQQDMRRKLDEVGTAVRNLLDSSTWLATFSQSEHEWVWHWIANQLFTFPRTGAPQRAFFPEQGANRFEHGLMVPLALFASTSYLTILRALAPEYRSTGEHREDLVDFAKALEVLAENMRREGLARTLYTAADFQGGAGGGIPFGLSPDEVVDLSAVGVPPFIAPGSRRWAVGALDLCVHNNAYFTPGFSASPIQHPGNQYAKQGLLNVRWIPPAVLEAYQESIPPLGFELPNRPPPARTRYRIINPEECAKAANAQAELDYTDLLYSSGYLNLVHLVAVLRNEATDPDHSQTVRADAWLRRKPGKSVAVTVKSAPILVTGQISASAERQPQDYTATVYLTTQPTGRNRSLNYRVWLRTLGASFSAGGSYWNEQKYDQFYQANYGDDSANPGFKKLLTTTGTPWDQIKIAEGKSSAVARNASGNAVLKAITFDWWIPVKPLGSHGVDLREAAKLRSLRAVGWEADPAAAPLPLPPETGNDSAPSAVSGSDVFKALTHIREDLKLSDFVGWIDAVEPASGQHREGEASEIRLEYSLYWQGDQMRVTLKNRAKDRNFVVYVVVEETLASGAVLHTTQRIPVIGQLTYVPQSFFDEEETAIARLAETLRDFARRYSISASDVQQGPTNPGDPDPRYGILGYDFQRIMADPVLRELHLNSFTTPQALEQWALRAVQKPKAAALLRRSLLAANMPKAAVDAMLRSAAAKARKTSSRGAS
jgi:hypothetical protein